MILVVNTGSSSLKAKLFDGDSLEVVQAFSYSKIINKSGYRRAAIQLAHQIAKYADLVRPIVYRIVMGGPEAIDGELVTNQVLKRLRDCANLAPLHSLPAITVIETLRKKFPKIPNILVYDTSFYKDLPESEFRYPLDEAMCKKLGIRKYGFHGISHRYAYEKAGGDYERVVTLHLGAGCSATAIYKGKAVATSMGLTPQGGLLMQTRCGDIDPGVIFRIASRYGLEHTKLLLESRSGLRGLTASDGDMLRLLLMSGYPVEDPSFHLDKVVDAGSKHIAQLAIEMFCQRARDYIGAYSARMCGLDAIIFTGKIGFGSAFIREKITFGLDYLHLKRVSAVETDEEFAIADMILKRNH